MHTTVNRLADLWDVVVSPDGAVCQGAVTRLEGPGGGDRERYALRFTQITRHGRTVETVDESRSWSELDATGHAVQKFYRLHSLQQSQAIAFDHAGRAALVYAAYGHSNEPGDNATYQWLRYAAREADGRWTLETVREWRIRPPRLAGVSTAMDSQDAPAPAPWAGAAPRESRHRGTWGPLPKPGVSDDVHLWCTSSLTFARAGQPMFLLLLTPNLDDVPPCLWEVGEVTGSAAGDTHCPACQRGSAERTDAPCSPACLADSELHLLWRGENGWQGEQVDTGVRYLGSGTQRVRPGFLHFGYDGRPSVAYARTRTRGEPGGRELVLAQRGPDGRWRHDALSNGGAFPNAGSSSSRFLSSSLVGALPA